MGISVDEVKLNFNHDSLWLLNICLAVVMFGVALDLRLNDFKLLIKNPKPSFFGIFSQFLLLPFLTFLLVLLLKPIPSIAIGMILVAACPGGNISNFMTHLAKGNSALSISLTAFATLFAVIMTPLNLKIWGSLYPPTASVLREVSLDPFDLFKTIALIMIVPLITGMIVNVIHHKTARKLSRILKPISITIFIAFVIIAFSKNTDVFLEYFHHVVLIVFVHNGIAILSGYWTARLAGLSFQNQKTLAIETGIQNSGLGLILVFGFFDGLGGMAIVAAWWGIWHIVSGLSIAWYWSENSDKTQRSIFKKVWYYFVKSYIFLAFQFHFSKIIVRGKENIPKNGPVLFVANHQNALLDALVTAVYNKRHTHFLVRADVFKNKIISILMGTLNMMPVFRVRDGMSSIKRNDNIFNYCHQLLQQGEAILIFPEGNHSMRRQIRPLSKGFTRLAFGALQKNEEMIIQIVPIGLNYENHQAFRKGVSIYFGRPVLANKYYQPDEQHSSSVRLREVVSSEMKKLTTHVESVEKYEEIVERLNAALPDYLDPEATNQTIDLINQGEKIKSPVPVTLRVNYLFGVLYSISRLINFPPHIIWSYASKKVKDPVMAGTVKFVAGITLFPIYYLIISAIVAIYFNFWIGFMTLGLLSFSLTYYHR